MKKLTYLLVPLALLCCGCEKNSGVREDGTEIYKTDKVYRSHTFNYIEVDGHEYLVWGSCHQGGITHSPRCWCNAERLR